MVWLKEGDGLKFRRPTRLPEGNVLEIYVCEFGDIGERKPYLIVDLGLDDQFAFEELFLREQFPFDPAGINFELKGVRTRNGVLEANLYYYLRNIYSWDNPQTLRSQG